MAKLGECFSVIRNGASIRQTDGAGVFPITRIETIADKTINREKFGYAEIYDLAQYRDYILQDGDILMSHINSEKHLGKVALYSKQDDEQIIHGMNLLMLRADTQKVIPEYAKYYFESQKFLRQIGRITKKSVNQASFTVTALKELEIPLASIIVQRDISEKLKKVDWLISLRKQQLAKLDELVKARFVEMFGSYPENENAYPVVNVSDIADAGVGVVIKPAQYYVTEECGIKAFRSLNIGEMYIKDSDWVYFSTEGNESNKKSQLHENDLLIVRSGAPGTACVVTKEFEGCNAVDVIIAHPDLSKVNPWYLCAYINYPHGKKQIEEGTGGAAQQHFNVGKCNNLKILLPPLALQNEFAAFVERVDQQKQTVQQSLEKLELMKKALMQEYFG